MASLTHVCMWSEHGWKRITAEEAARLHPGGTVSARSGLFMCELCGQYVTLTDGNIRERYFKHSAYEKSKDCPERTFGANVTVVYDPEKHDLPLRVTGIRDSDFTLELGLLCVPEDLLRKADKKTVEIWAQGEKRKVTYLFERLQEGSITYVPLPGSPAQLYHIEADKTLRAFWPALTKGIDAQGALFDSQTGKKLELDADAALGKKYYYVGQRSLYGCADVEVRHISSKMCGWSSWQVYEVRATALTEEAACFFLDLHCRLTDRPLMLQPVWPVYEERPYIYLHNADDMFIHLTGQNGITTRTFPAASIRVRPCTDAGQILKINCNGRQQLISAGRTHMLQYTYLWKDPLERETETPKVQVRDFFGESQEQGVKESLPEKGLLNVLAPFDGYIELSDAGGMKERIPLPANTGIDLTGLQMADTVRILQGLDVVWYAEYAKRNADFSGDETELLRKLETCSGDEIPIGHSIGALAGKLQAYPQVKRWLYKKIREGTASRRAVGYLRKWIDSESQGGVL